MWNQKLVQRLPWLHADETKPPMLSVLSDRSAIFEGALHTAVVGRNPRLLFSLWCLPTAPLFKLCLLPSPTPPDSWPSLLTLAAASAEMNVAYAWHEGIADHIVPCLVWFQSNGTLSLQVRVAGFGDGCFE